MITDLHSLSVRPQKNLTVFLYFPNLQRCLTVLCICSAQTNADFSKQGGVADIFFVSK